MSDIKDYTGCLVFTRSKGGVFAWINWKYQQRRRGRSWPRSKHWEHVGIIGRDGIIIESRLSAGGVVAERTFAEVIADPNVVVCVARPRGDWGPFAALRALSKARKFVGVKNTSYDLWSLLTFGALQANDSMICSELGATYYNELIRKTDLPMLDLDGLVLPIDLFDLCDAVETRTPS